MHAPLLVLALSLPVAGSTTPPTDVLAQWDRAREAAFAAADPTGLRALYVPGSSAASSDVSLLRDYVARDLKVWLRTQRFSVRNLHSGDDMVRLRVTDRVLSAVGDGVRCRALPASRTATRDVRLTRLEGRWVVESVSQAPRRGSR